ncbi:uncharacterized protein LOC143287607 isoform X2 [Babylonia areolata]
MAEEAETADLCSRKVTDSCPSGHELIRCRYVEGFRCRQCGPLFFQPNENRHKDRCRLRRVCQKPHMRYKDHGSTTRDADCKCDAGFHFENVDQRACVPNRYCSKGYGQGEYGVCVKCLDQNMYSDTNDRKHQCKPLTNCEKHSRCTLVKSNGTFDNVCGPKVRDTKSCDEPQPAAAHQTGDPRLLMMAGGVAAAVLFVVIVLIVIFIVRRSRLRRRDRRSERPLSQDQLEDLRVKVLEDCGQDGALCKKVLSKSVFVVEERVERQIWTLAQELYRSHPVQGRYELIVEKYKESQPKYAVNGYLQEWKSWRGENQEAVAELFRCLRQCKRDDIVYEICNGLRHDVDFEPDTDTLEDEEGGTCRAKPTFRDDLREVFCPCVGRGREEKKAAVKGKAVIPDKELQKDQEACGKLLDLSSSREPEGDVYSAGSVYRSRPCPSAPVLEDSHGPDDVLFSEAQLALYRQYSQPVQATT